MDVRRCRFIDPDGPPPVRLVGDSRAEDRLDGIALVVEARGLFACAAIFGRLELFFLEDP